MKLALIFTKLHHIRLCLRQISTRQNERRFRRETTTKLFWHETIFNFYLNNFGVIIVKNKQNFNNNVTVLLKMRLFVTSENVMSN